MCLIEGQWLTKNLTKNLRQYLSGQNLLNYWQSKGQISQQMEPIIEWTAANKAMKALPAAK